jgi:hypothetical protein
MVCPSCCLVGRSAPSLDPGRKEEPRPRVKFPDLGLVDIGHEYMLEYVETLNAGSLFDKLTSRQAASLPPRA